MRAIRLLVVLLPVFALAAGSARADWGDYVYQSPGIDPPGINVPCVPSAQHPVPVVLVHGTFADRTISWNLIGEKLVQDGYCVFSLDYGRRATLPVADSAKELAAFVSDVLKQTGASRVSIVGHSQGGMMPRYYAKFLGGDQVVDDLIGLAPSNHGTTLQAAAWGAQYGDCPSCGDQEAGSPFIENLNAGDETPQPDPSVSSNHVSYTNIESSHDEVVTPYTSAFLAGSPDEVTNVLLQDKCPLDTTEHLGIIYDPVALQWVENALATPGPADSSFTPICG